MIGIEKITGRLLEDAQTQANDIVAKAQAEAQQILAQYQAQAKKEADEIVRRGAERAEERLENLSGTAQLEARKDILASKQAMIDEAFSLAAKKLSALKGDEYVALLASLAADASYNGSERIVLSRDDRKAYGEAVVSAANALLAKKGRPAQLTLAEESRETGGGLLLADGKIETNCSYETLLRLVRNDISGEVASLLFN